MGQSRRHDVLGQITRGIGGGAINLGGILAGKRSAAMRRRASVSIDDNLAASKPGIAVRASNHELACRIDVPFRVIAHPSFGQNLADVRLNDAAHVLAGKVGIKMLRRQHNRRHCDRHIVFVANRYLGFGVRPKLRLGAALAGLCQPAKHGMGV